MAVAAAVPVAVEGKNVEVELLTAITSTVNPKSQSNYLFTQVRSHTVYSATLKSLKASWLVSLKLMPSQPEVSAGKDQAEGKV